MSQEEETTETTVETGSNNNAMEQEKIDKIVKDRLDRERKKFEREKADLLKPFEGVDKDEYARLKQEAEDRENKKLEEQGKFEELRKKWSADLEKTKTEYQKKLDEKDATLRRLVLDEKVRSVALKSGVCPEDVEDVLTLTSKFFAMEDDGSIRVLGDDGHESIDSLDDFFGKTFKEKKPKFYQGSTASGSGASPSAPNKKTDNSLEAQLAKAEELRNVPAMISLKRRISEQQKKQ